MKNFIEVQPNWFNRHFYREFIYIDKKTFALDELKLLYLVPEDINIKYIGRFNNDKNNTSCQPHWIRVPKKYGDYLIAEVFPKLHNNLQIVYDDYMEFYDAFNKIIESIKEICKEI